MYKDKFLTRDFLKNWYGLSFRIYVTGFSWSVLQQYFDWPGVFIEKGILVESCQLKMS